MYSIDSVMSWVWDNQGTTIALALICYSVGFANYACSLWMQLKNKDSVFPFWTHCWYFGSDVAFGVILFRQWLDIGWWFWIALGAFNMVFVFVELWTLYITVKNERQAIFGKYINGRPVSMRYAMTRGLMSYAVGVLLFQSIRMVIGDPMCIVLFTTTIALEGVTVPMRLSETGTYKRGMRLLSIVNVLNVALCFAPYGIGYFPTLLPSVLDTPWYRLAGAVVLGFCIYGVYVAWVKNPRADKERLQVGTPGALAAPVAA